MYQSLTPKQLFSSRLSSTYNIIIFFPLSLIFKLLNSHFCSILIWVHYNVERVVSWLCITSATFYVNKILGVCLNGLHIIFFKLDRGLMMEHYEESETENILGIDREGINLNGRACGMCRILSLELH